MTRKAATFFPLDDLDLAFLKKLKEKLIRFEYNQETIQSLLQSSWPYIYVDPLYLPVFKYLVKENTPTNLLISLFLLRTPLNSGPISALFSRDEIAAMSRMNILAVDPRGGRVRSKMAIYPFQDFFFFTDQGPVKRHHSVYHIGLDSFYLGEALAGMEGDSCLDLCCGSGFHAILASRRCAEVIGVDINPRAIQFARFNSIFNGVENVTFKAGNLYEPVRGRKFDLLLANPPFVAVPSGKKILYQDGGRLGDDFLEAILAGISKHLKPQGIGLVIAEIKKREHLSNEETLRLLAGNARLKILQIPIADGCTCSSCYSVGHCRSLLIRHDFQRYEKEVTQWYDNLRRSRITNVTLTLLCMKRWKGFRLVMPPADASQADIKRTVKYFSVFGNKS
jgi:carbamoyltransferase